MTTLELEMQLAILNERIDRSQQTLADLKAERRRLVDQLAEMKKGKSSEDHVKAIFESLQPRLPEASYVPPGWREVGE